MRTFLLLCMATLFVLAGCSSDSSPATSSLATLDCAQLPVSALQTAFSAVGVTAPFQLTSSTERKCQYAAGTSPNSQMTVGVSVEGSSSEADAQELFERKKNAVSAAGGNPNWQPTTDSNTWNTALGFGSGYYTVKTPAGPAQTTTLNLHGRAASGQLITIAVTYYGDADFTALRGGAQNIASQVHTLITA